MNSRHAKTIEFATLRTKSDWKWISMLSFDTAAIHISMSYSYLTRWELNCTAVFTLAFSFVYNFPKFGIILAQHSLTESPLSSRIKWNFCRNLLSKYILSQLTPWLWDHNDYCYRCCVCVALCYINKLLGRSIVSNVSTAVRGHFNVVYPATGFALINAAESSD